MPYVILGLWPDDGQYGPIEHRGTTLKFLSLFKNTIAFLIERISSYSCTNVRIIS
jgi:hypothetical protein